MIVSKKKVLAKTNGRCAYCFRPLTVKTMQRDHKEPIIRWRNVKWTFSGIHGCSKPENHTLDNIVAACRACNLSKGSMDLETWRSSLHWPGWQNGIVFYFEKIQE